MTTSWLFLDFDNTLMATEHLALPSLIERFNELYRHKIDHLLTIDEFKQYFHGQARETLCASLSNHFGVHVDYSVLYDAREWRMMQILQKKGVQMASNLIETLNILQNQGYQFAFVSNNSIQRGLASMRYATNGQGNRLARFFGTAFFEAGDIQKPYPSVYLRAIEQLNISPKNCFAIEDSPTGVSAAVSAGIKTFGYLEFADNPQEMAKRLTEKGAFSCFQDWNELPFLLAS